MINKFYLTLKSISNDKKKLMKWFKGFLIVVYGKIKIFFGYKNKNMFISKELWALI